LNPNNQELAARVKIVTLFFFCVSVKKKAIHIIGIIYHGAHEQINGGDTRRR